MTLILAVTNPEFVTHVSDRLLTRSAQPFDPLANKTVVFDGRDGLIAVSYTGAAYVRGQTTDNWIAEQLFGRPLKVRGFGLAEGPFVDVGRAMRRLADAATSLGRAWHDAGGEFLANGFVWPWKRPGRGHPVHWTIRALAPRRYVAQQHMPRVGDYSMLTAIPSGTPFEGELMAETRARIWEAGMDHDGVERALVDAVRKASKTSNLIGGDCVSVSFPRTAHVVRVRYFPEDPDGPNAHDAYSPWIVSPRCWFPPSAHRGSLLWKGVADGRRLLVEFDFPPPPGSFAGSSTQDRPPAPGWRDQWPRPNPQPNPPHPPGGRPGSLPTSD